jgi:hypothetical protein
MNTRALKALPDLKQYNDALTAAARGGALDACPDAGLTTLRRKRRTASTCTSTSSSSSAEKHDRRDAAGWRERRRKGRGDARVGGW